jgi:hypothetical protein
MAVPADDRGVVQSSNRFGSASDEDMNDILTDLNAKNTDKSTKFAVELEVRRGHTQNQEIQIIF